MRGQHLLSANGIRSRINRNTAKNSKTGCGYVLSVSESDKAAAEKIQKALRNYLEVRFDYPFTRTVTSDIMAGWQSVTGGLCSDKKEEAFGEIAACFIRTDYIRYSKGGAFEKDELVKLVDKLVLIIETLEKPEEASA